MGCGSSNTKADGSPADVQTHVISEKTSPTAAASTPKPPAKVAKAAAQSKLKTNKFKYDKVKIEYFGLLGRADPLVQMFEYHGQPYEKVSIE